MNNRHGQVSSVGRKNPQPLKRRILTYLLILQLVGNENIDKRIALLCFRWAGSRDGSISHLFCLPVAQPGVGTIKHYWIKVNHPENSPHNISTTASRPKKKNLSFHFNSNFFLLENIVFRIVYIWPTDGGRKKIIEINKHRKYSHHMTFVCIIFWGELSCPLMRWH